MVTTVSMITTGVWVGSAVGVRVGRGVEVEVGLGDGEGVADGVGVAVGVVVNVGVGVGERVGPGVAVITSTCTSGEGPYGPPGSTDSSQKATPTSPAERKAIPVISNLANSGMQHALSPDTRNAIS
jgi:hypothetical protein